MLRLIVCINCVLFVFSCGSPELEQAESLEQSASSSVSTTETDEKSTSAVSASADEQRLAQDKQRAVVAPEAARKAEQKRIEELLLKVQGEWDEIKPVNPELIEKMELSNVNMYVGYMMSNSDDAAEEIRPELWIKNTSDGIIDGHYVLWTIYNYETQEEICSTIFESNIGLMKGYKEETAKGIFERSKIKPGKFGVLASQQTESFTMASGIISNNLQNYAYAAAVVALVRDGTVIADRRLDQDKVQELLKMLDGIEDQRALDLRKNIQAVLDARKQEMLNSLRANLKVELGRLKGFKRIHLQTLEKNKGKDLSHTHWPFPHGDRQEQRMQWLRTQLQK